MPKDKLGRSSDMNPEQLKGVAQSLKGPVGKETPYNNTPPTDKGGDSMSQGLEKSYKKLVNLLNTFMSGKKSGKAAQNEKISVNADKALQTMVRHATKRGSIYTHDVYLEKAARVSNLELKAMRLEMKRGKSSDDRQSLAVALNEIIEINKEMAEYLANPAREEEARKATEEKNNPINILKDQTEKHLEKVKEGLIPLQLMRDLGDAAGELQKTIYGFRGTEVVFDGLLEKERDFTINARQIAYEISGATSESHGLQRSFEDIGKTAAKTGFDRTKTTNAYLANLKKGLRDQKSALSVSKTQLQTERMIGVEAGSLGDTFSDMSLKMGMNTSQMSEFGRGVQEVARNTGVTGDELANAVKSSESIIKNMRKFGNLTAEAASNVVGVTASAEKFGAGELASNLLGTLSQGMSGFRDASSEMKSMISNALGNDAALMEQAMNGTLLLTKEGMKGLEKGLGNLIVSASGGLAKTAEEFDKLDANTKARINMTAKNAFGGTVNEIGQAIKAVSENVEPLAEKLRKIGEQKKKNLNAEEMAAKIEEERTLKTSTALGALTKLDEQLKISGDGAEGMKKALSSVDLSGFSADLKAMGIDSKDAGGAIKGALEASIKGVNEGLKKAGKSGLAIGAKDIAKALKDPKELEKVRKQIDDGNAELAVAQKNAADPMTKLRTSMEQLNDTLRGATQSAISTMMDSVFGRSLGLVTTLVDVGGQFAGFVFDSVLEYAQLGASLAILSLQFGVTAGSAAATIAGLWGEITARIASIPALIASAGGLAGVAAAAWAAAAPLLLVVGYFLAWAAVVAGVWGMFSQAAKSGEKAGALFDKNMEDVTTAEYYAAKGAGFMTGALNTLTFGLFDSFIGAEGTITKALAQFNKIFPIMSAVMMVFDAIAGAIYGIGSSILDYFIAPFEALYYILEPIGEVFNTIGSAISTALGPLFGFSTTLSETGTVFTMFSNIFSSFGKAYRGISRAIGQTIGFLIRIVTTVLNPVIMLVGHLLGGVATIIGTVFKSVFDWFMGAFKVLEGIATLDFGKIGSGLWTMISATFLHIPKLLLSVFTFAFKLLYIQIPQAVLGIFWSAFKLLYIQLPRFLIGIPKMIFDSIWSGLTSLASNDWVGPIFQPFLDILAPINEALGVLYSAFDELFKAVNLLLEPVYFLFDAIGSLFSSSESAGESMGFLKSIIYGVSSAIGFVIKAALFPIQLLFRGLALVLQPVIWFVNLLTSAISSLIKPLWSVVGTLLNGFVEAISYVGLIFQPFLDILAPINEAFGALYSAFDELFKAVNLLLEPVYFLFDAIGSLFRSSESAGESMGFLTSIISGVSSAIGSIIYGISSAIGFLIKVALFPIQLIFKGLALVLQPVIWFVNLLTSAISSLIKPLWSVVGTLLNGFVEAISYVGEVIGGVMSSISEGINRVRKVISDIVDFIMAPFKWLYEYLGGIFSSIPETLSNALYSGMSNVGLGWLFDNIAGTSGGKTKPAETKSPAEAAVAAIEQPKIEIDEESFSRIFGAAKTQEMLAKKELGFSQKDAFDAMKNAMDPFGVGGAVQSLTGFDLTGAAAQGLTGISPASTSQTVASPIAATTIDERIQRDLATSEPEMASVGGPELGAIAESSDVQVEKLTLMVGLLQSMLDNQRETTGNTSYPAELASMNEIPKKPIRTYPLSTGKYAQSASKQIKNASQTG